MPEQNNAPDGWEEESRKEISEILGLETAPDGTKDMLLTRDEHGTVLEGCPFAEEVTELLKKKQEWKAEGRAEMLEEAVEAAEQIQKTFKEHHDCGFNDGDCDCECFVEAGEKILTALQALSKEK